VPNVLVVGSLNTDFTVILPRLPGPGETVLGGTLAVGAGGKGANQAAAARRLGADVRMIGCVGEDDAGGRLREGLAALGVGVDGVLALPGVATGAALIMVDALGRNQIGVAPGANGNLTPEMAAAREDDVRWAQVVLCQLETPLPVVRWALSAARRHGVVTILNPAPAAALPDDLLRLVDYLTPNESEAAALAGTPAAGPDAASEAARRLCARGAGQVVVTLGAQGALACDGTQALHFPAFPVTVVDTTGAGDAFNGGLATGLAAGGSLEQAIPLAGAAAALACTRPGAQASLPDRADVERFLRSLRGAG
jgi:ribokinase